MEEWRDIPGYEGFYQVSSMGNIKSVCRVDSRGRERGGNIMTPHANKKGYLMVHLSKNDGGKFFQVHRLVAFAFPEICGEWFKGAQVNHKDENKANNRAENLEWCTSKYNNNYGHRTEKVSKRVKQLDLNGNVIETYKSASEASRATKTNRGNIYSCLNGLRDTANNFRWRFAK